jgi:hypothetical protein
MRRPAKLLQLVAAWVLLQPNCVQAKSQIGISAWPFLTDGGSLLPDTRSLKTAIIVLASLLVMVVLLMQFGEAARVEKGAEVAFSRACQLLRQADRENRNVRPLPLSVATDSRSFPSPIA